MEPPVSSGGWQQEVAKMRRMLDSATALSVSVELPILTAAELCVLGALNHPVVDVHTRDWWRAHPDQETLTRRAYSHMADRDLFDPDTRRMSPELGLILAVRSQPGFILLTRDHPDAGPRRIRGYGIAGKSSNLLAVLLESALPYEIEWAGPGYQYKLVSIELEALFLSKWAAQGNQRTIDLLPGSGLDDPAERFIISPARHRKMRLHRVTTGTQAWEPTICTKKALASLISSLMTRGTRQ